MSQLSVILQETVRREREARTLLEILREQMDDTDGTRGGRRTFKQRLRLNGFGCCGAAWVFGRTAAISVRDGDEDDQEPQNHHLPLPPQQRVVSVVGQAQPVNNWDPDCVGPISTGSGMNLAAALAAERQFRAPQESDGGGSVVGPGGDGSAVATAPGTPTRVSLMRLLEETEVDGCDAFGGATTESDKAEGGLGNDTSVFEGGVVESRFLSPLQPFDPRDPRYILRWFDDQQYKKRNYIDAIGRCLEIRVIVQVLMAEFSIAEKFN
ncbi:unnamed protein product [Prunus brigantina]